MATLRSMICWKSLEKRLVPLKIALVPLVLMFSLRY
jgi:hypothetical protein